MARGVPSQLQRRLGPANQAASSVIATVTMVGIVVLLGATALWMSLSFSDPEGGQAQFPGMITESRSQGDGFDMRAIAGSPVPIQGSTLIVTADGARAEYPLATFDALRGQISWPPGERICIVGTTSDCVVATASVVQVSLIVDGVLVYMDRVVLSPFLLTGAGIQTSCAGPVTYRIVHVASTYGPLGPGLGVNVSLSDDGGSNWENPWMQAVASGDSYTEPLVGAGSLIALRGHGEATGLDATYDSHPADPHVFVGLDGAAVPSVLAFAGAASVEDDIEPYVDFVGGTFTLQANEAIVLWEFDPAIVSATSDYQDTVVLLTLPPAAC